MNKLGRFTQDSYKSEDESSGKLNTKKVFVKQQIFKLKICFYAKQIST
jgi:hypothetical protein